MRHSEDTTFQTMKINWKRELAKHDKLLKGFSVLQSLTYDLDTTFHKLFGLKTKGGIKSDMWEAKRQMLIEAGYTDSQAG